MVIVMVNVMVNAVHRLVHDVYSLRKKNGVQPGNDWKQQEEFASWHQQKQPVKQVEKCQTAIG